MQSLGSKAASVCAFRHDRELTGLRNLSGMAASSAVGALLSLSCFRSIPVSVKCHGQHCRGGGKTHQGARLQNFFPRPRQNPQFLGRWIFHGGAGRLTPAEAREGVRIRNTLQVPP